MEICGRSTLLFGTRIIAGGPMSLSVEKYIRAEETIKVNDLGTRKKYIDAAKGWGILMVVFGHITSLGNPVDIWFASYKLAIFFIVSGYLLCMRQSFRKLTVGAYIKKQAKGLLIPYLGYSAIVILYNVFICIVKKKGTEEILKKVAMQAYTTFCGRGISALWFLPCLFIAQVLLILVIRSHISIKLICAVLPLITSQYIAGLLPQMKAQMDPQKYELLSMPILTISKGILGFWFVGCGYVAFLLLRYVTGRYQRIVLGLVMFGVNLYLSQLNSGVDMNLMGIGKYPILFYGGGILGSVSTLLILEFLEKWWRMEFLEFCGKNSLIIMATHGTLGFKAFAIGGWKAIGALSENLCLRYYIECCCILAELMLMEYGVIHLIHRYLPWLEGKNGKVRKQT